MAARRKPAAAPEAEPDALELEPTPEQALAEYFGSGAPGDVSVSIYELAGESGRERAFLFAFPMESAPPPHELYGQILEKWGAGHYEVFAQHPDGRIAFRKSFRCGSDRERRRAVIPDRPGAQQATPAAPSIPPELTAILTQQARTLETIAEAMKTDKPREERGTLEIARELAQIKELFAPPPPTSNAFELVKDVLALKDQLTSSDGGGGESSPLSTAAKHLAPALQRALERFAPAEAAQTQQPNSGAPGASAPANGADTGMRAWLGQLRELAQAEAPPADAAQRVLDALAAQPAWVEQAVLGLVVEERERATDRVIALAPELAAHQSWLVSVVGELVNQIEPEQEHAPEPAGAAPAHDAAGSSP